MEKKVALIRKSDNRIENIILVADFRNIEQYATDSLNAVKIEENQTAYINGVYENGEFYEPTNEYLIEIGLVDANYKEEISATEDNG